MKEIALYFIEFVHEACKITYRYCDMKTQEIKNLIKKIFMRGRKRFQKIMFFVD